MWYNYMMEFGFLEYLIIILIGLLFFKEQLMGFIANKLGVKQNGVSNAGIRNKLDELTDNHLHEVAEILREIQIQTKDNGHMLERIQNRLESACDNLTYVKARLNGKDK